MSISNDLRRLRGNSKMARAVWTESKFLLSSIYIVYRNVAPIPPILMRHAAVRKKDVHLHFTS